MINYTMTKSAPIQLENGTTIYIEATEYLDIPKVSSLENVGEEEEEEEARDMNSSYGKIV